MSVIRFTQISLLLALIMMNHLAAPGAVNSGSKIDKSDIQLSGDDAKSFLHSIEKRGGLAEECRENSGGICDEEESEEVEAGWWK